MNKPMEQKDRVNILLVDDQPAKLLSYEVVLRDLDENLIKAASATEALELLLKNDIAVILVDVCMPDLDGFELAAMIRNHPRFQRTAIIFISAVLLADTDYLRGYEMGAVDYVPVPVVPELLRAKVRVFAELYRKTRDLEELNQELERRVAARTAELQSTAERLIESERTRSMALAAGQMGSWDWDAASGECTLDAGQYRIFGVEFGTLVSFDDARRLIHPADLVRFDAHIANPNGNSTFQEEIRITRANGDQRWCICTAALTIEADGQVSHASFVIVDITERKLAEERQLLLAREVDHRARNALAVVQAIVRLTRETSQQAYVQAVEGRIHALAKAHTLLSEARWHGADVADLVAEELAPYRTGEGERVKIDGPSVMLPPEKAQNLALALHELATNSAKYGSLSVSGGRLELAWATKDGMLSLSWQESGGPVVVPPARKGFGTKIMNASVKHQAGDDVVFEWHPSGLRCLMRLSILRSAPLRRDISIGQSAGPKSVGIKKRVLLVEDEVLVGMMMHGILLDSGLDVVGPCRSVAAAIAALETGDFDCGILDLNLSGETTYAVARALTDRAVPYAFVTGYGRESISAAFQDVPVLQKPVVREELEKYLLHALGPAGTTAVAGMPTHVGAGIQTRAST